VIFNEQLPFRASPLRGAAEYTLIRCSRQAYFERNFKIFCKSAVNTCKHKENIEQKGAPSAPRKGAYPPPQTRKPLSKPNHLPEKINKKQHTSEPWRICATARIGLSQAG
ncbi:MAG: hypothetical protein MJ051_04925, partial [Akkermansia sp.]|nr:hypothetical protein [Akkermansia sp.]